jgi:hypothetical protein
MRFPSLVTLSTRAQEVLLRFPWTIGVGVLAAVTAILATTKSADPDDRVKRETAAAQILEAAAITYVSEYSSRNEGYIYVWARQDSVTPISGYDWMLTVSHYDKTPIVVGQDTVHARFDSTSGILSVRVGADSLDFDLGRLAGAMDHEPSAGAQVAAERLRLETAGRKHKAMLALESLNGKRAGNSIQVERWQGRLFLGKALAPDPPPW